MEGTLDDMVQQLRTRLTCPSSTMGELVNLILVDSVGALPKIHVPPSSFLMELDFALLHATNVSQGKLSTSLALEVGFDLSKPIKVVLSSSSVYDT